MLNDKYSYYQREHSEKLIASICLMSVCVHTCGEGSDFWFLCNTELPAWAAEGVPAPRGDSEFLRITWQAHQQIPQGCRTGHTEQGQEDPGCLRDAPGAAPGRLRGIGAFRGSGPLWEHRLGAWAEPALSCHPKGQGVQEIPV